MAGQADPPVLSLARMRPLLPHRQNLDVDPSISSTFFLPSAPQPNQAGAIKSLQRHYKLQDAQFLGASAGALTACCAAANVDMDNAFEVAARCVGTSAE